MSVLDKVEKRLAELEEQARFVVFNETLLEKVRLLREVRKWLLEEE